MSNYSDKSLCELLDSYWLLFEGAMPRTSGGATRGQNPAEFSWIIKADIDKGINSLTNDCRWNDVLSAMNAYYQDGLAPWLVFEDAPKYFHMLNKYQKAVVRHHFTVGIGTRITDEIESKRAAQARKMMLRYLNAQITPREWDIVNRLVKSLSF
jgi:hypothetical protein